jgi:hypothetical protein
MHAQMGNKDTQSWWQTFDMQSRGGLPRLGDLLHSALVAFPLQAAPELARDHPHPLLCLQFPTLPHTQAGTR